MHTFKIFIVIGPQGVGKTRWIDQHIPDNSGKCALHSGVNTIADLVYKAVQNVTQEKEAWVSEDFSLSAIVLQEVNPDLSIGSDMWLISKLIKQTDLEYRIPYTQNVKKQPMPDLYIEIQSEEYPYGEIGRITAETRLNPSVSQIHIVHIKKSSK